MSTAHAHKEHKPAQKAAKKSEHVVCIENSGFKPSTISIKVGESVTFQNDDSVPHSVSFDRGETHEIAPGEFCTQEFPTAGTFVYKCNLHPTMTGGVTVS